MSKWFFSSSRAFALLASVVLCCQASRAGEFSVANRDEVLILTSKIQATQFLTHATFGPTQAEIDALATQMRAIGTIQAASNWIDEQTNEAIHSVSAALHSPLEFSMVQTDLPYSSMYTRTGTAPRTTSTLRLLSPRPRKISGVVRDIASMLGGTKRSPTQGFVKKWPGPWLRLFPLAKTQITSMKKNSKPPLRWTNSSQPFPGSLELLRYLHSECLCQLPYRGWTSHLSRDHG